MIQIAPDMAEIQMVQARQAQQQAPAQGIASQWSAAQQGLAPSPLSTVTAANPMSGGLGGGMAPAAGGALPAMTRTQSAQVEAAEEEKFEERKYIQIFEDFELPIVVVNDAN